MKGHTLSIVCMSVLATLALSDPRVADASAACQFADRELRREVAALEASVGRRIIAVGRVDAISASRGISVLGSVVRPSAGEVFQIGDYAAVIDWSRRGDRSILEVRHLGSRYIPGASEVYVQAPLKQAFGNAQAKVGNVSIDFSRHVRRLERQRIGLGTALAVRGVQPHPGGVVLGSCITVVEGSMGTGRLNGSMGTGRTDGSMGAGRLNGSMGTGRTDGSMGTGRLNGSMGTGRTDGSMGTGRLNGSMGTGRTDGSMGTGR